MADGRDHGVGSGDIQYHISRDGDSTLLSSPFQPTFTQILVDTGDYPDPADLPKDAYGNLYYNGELTGFSVRFNQAYIYNRVAQTQLSRLPQASKIENMSEEHYWGLKDKVDYFVEVVINKDNFLIEKAVFTGLSGAWEAEDEDNGFPAPRPIDTATDFPHILFDQYDSTGFYTGYYPVLSLYGSNLTEYHQREDIVLSDRQFRQVGLSTSGDNGSAHILVHSGSHDENLPVRVRAVRGTGTVHVFEETDYVLLSGEPAGGGGATGTWSGENIGYGVGVYNEYTLDPAEFHSLRGTDNITVTLNGQTIDFGASYDNCSSDADWLAYKTLNAESEAEFRGLNAGTGIKFTKDVDHATNYCVTTISTDLQNCSPAGDWMAYKGTNGEKEEFRGLTFGDGIKYAAGSNGTQCAPTIQTDIANCDTSADWYAFKGYDGDGTAEFKGLSWGVGISASSSDTCRDVIRTQLENCDSDGAADWWSYKGSTATHEQFRGLKAGEGITISVASDCIGTISRECCTGTETYAVQKLTNINNNNTNLEFPTADTSTARLNCDGNQVVLVDPNQMSIQGGTDPTKGQIQLGNVSTQTVKVEQEDGYPSLKLGAGIKRLDAEWVDEGGSDVFKAFEKSSVSIANKNSYIKGDYSPATGSAILGGSGNAISGNYNVIVGGATNKISGLNMNFIGGGSGVDITRSEFSVSVGGRNNDISGSNFSVIGGGYDNLISGGGGRNVIGGGYSNEIYGASASNIAGGYENIISGNYSSTAIAGGTDNKAYDTYCFIGAGASHTIHNGGNGAAIVGGAGNIISGTASFIGGGINSYVSGSHAVALGNYSRVSEGHNGAFVFTDSVTTPVFSKGADTMHLKFKSGVYLTTDSGLYINGNAVLTGETPEGDTLQTVTSRGNLTTTDILSEGEISGASGEFGGQMTVLGKLAVGHTYSSYNATIDGTLQVKDITNGTYDGLLFTSNVGGEGRIKATNTDLGTKHPLWVGGEYLKFTVETGTEVEAMRIVQGDDGKGFVGIGTTDPDTKLHLQSGRLTIAGNGSEAIKVTNSDIVNFDSSTVRADLFRASALSDQLEFRGGSNRTRLLNSDGGTELFTITNAGQVGIGSTSPAYELDVAGSIQAKDSAVFAGMNAQRGYTFHDIGTGWGLKALPSNTRLAMQVQGIESMTWESNGRVGIGTTDPEDLLTVSAGAGGSTTDLINVGGTGNGRILVRHIDGKDSVSAATGPLFLNYGISENVSLAYGGGNVGIGSTSNPQALLHVHKSNTVGPTIELSNSEYRAYINSWGSTASAGRRDRFEINATKSDFAVASSGIYFQIGGAGDSYEKMRITSDGDVCIGNSSAGGKLDILTDSSTTNGVALRLESSTGSYLIVKHGGDVGIGTHTPARKLDVVGDAAVSTTLNVGSDIQASGWISSHNTGTSRIYTSEIQGDSSANALVMETDGAGNRTRLYNYGTSTDLLIESKGSSSDIRINAREAIRFYTSGSASSYSYGGQRMTIAEGGNVGIGTSSPSAKVHLNGPSAGFSEIMRLQRDGGNYYSIGLDNGDLNFCYNGQSADGSTLVIDGAADSVGIGTKSPAYELDVVGTIHGSSGNFESGITVNGNPVLTGTSAYETDTLQTVTDDGNTTTNSVHISNAGFGADYAPLTVSGGQGGGTAPVAFFRGTGTAAYLQFQNSTTSYGSASQVGLTVGNNGNDGYVFNREPAPLYFGTSGEARMTILGDSATHSKVGIGTVSPSSTAGSDSFLDIYGATDAGLVISSNNGEWDIKNTNPTANLSFYAAGSHRVTFATAGNVGIGSSSPTRKLDVAGGIKTNNDGIQFTDSNAFINRGGSYMQLRTYAGNDIILMAGGTVGINQSSPSSTYALDVSGSIRMATAAPSLVLRETDSSNQEFSVFGLSGDFYVRDITQSTYPFKIEAGVATDTLVLESGGNVGIGTNAPASQLHVEGTIQTKVYAIGSLPSASPAGQKAFINNSSSSYSSSLVGADVNSYTGVGASNFAPVYSDGTYWRFG